MSRPVEAGQQVSDWTVLEILPRLDEKTRKARCRCSCGAIHLVGLYALQAGRSPRCKSCALKRARPPVPVPAGTPFGLWTVLGEAGMRAGARLVLCRCACGLEKKVSLGSLREGGSHGCKKCVHQTEGTLKVGDVVGEWALVADTGRRKNNPYFLCRCSCGSEEEVCYSSLRRGKSLRCTRCSQVYMTADSNRGPVAVIWKTVLAHAKARGLDVTISQEAAARLLSDQGGRCALTGLPIELGESQNKKGTASLDRIDSAKGYIEGNLQWVHKDLNRMKNIFSQEYFIDMCRWVAYTADGAARKRTA